MFYTIINNMKKYFLCLAIMIIMIAFTFGAGCVSDNAIPKTDSKYQEKFDFAWDIINNPREPYIILEREITSMDFSKLSTDDLFVLIEDKRNILYGGYHYMKFYIDIPKISNVKNGIYLYTSESDLFFIKDNERTDNLYLCVYEILERTNEIYRERTTANVVLLNPSDYEFVVSTLENNLKKE